MKSHLNTIPALWRKTVADNYDKIALIASDFARYTYGDIDHMAKAIRSLFAKHKPSRVGILMNHGPRQVASIMAVIEAGASYVAVEPSLPGTRIRRIFKEADVDFVITGRSNAVRVLKYKPLVLPSREKLLTMDADPEPVEVEPTTPAYILYTATRSGKRKGVVVDNDNVTHYVHAFSKEFNVGPGDVVLQASVCGFDTFVEELFVSLLSGAALAILPEDNRGDIRSIVDFCDRTGVTVICGFTSMVEAMNKLERVPEKLRLLISNGEALTPENIFWLKDKTTIYYSYGLSETTVRAAWHRCDNWQLAEGERFYPIGKPIEGVEIAILNENLEPVANGATGEICILGEGVARGYVGEDDESSFATMPDGRRVYLTGDMGSWDGNVFHFVEHADRSVVIEGRSVKCSEIENALCQNPDVENGVVCSFTDSKGKPYLVAYFTAKCSKAGVSLTGLRRHMKSLLAWFKVPEFYVQMKSLPTKRNGKVNTDALPQVLKDN